MAKSWVIAVSRCLEDYFFNELLDACTSLNVFFWCCRTVFSSCKAYQKQGQKSEKELMVG